MSEGPRRIYVAGASAEIDSIEKYISKLETSGWKITHDWCKDVRRMGGANHGFSRKERERLAEADVYGVMDAEIVWLLVPQAPSIGCWTELGVAMALGRTLVVSGDDERTIFTALAPCHFRSHDEAAKWLCGLLPNERPQ